MTYVLDASVAVAALRPAEAHHAACRAYVSPLLNGRDAVVVPSIFRIEVASALARGGFTAAECDRFVNGFLPRATVVTIGPARSRRIQALAIATRLRAADAIYVWLAGSEGIPLVTVDQEMQRRAASRCQIIVPR